MIPLPPKVFLTGEAAENAAYELFRAIGLVAPGLQPLADGLHSGDLQHGTEGQRFESSRARTKAQLRLGFYLSGAA
jgi:hypothetical protein